MKRYRLHITVLLLLLLPLVAFGATRIGLAELSDAVLRLRVARVILAIAVGAALAVSGVIFQSILRNPLAEPYILGVSAGGGLGAAVAIILGPTLLGAALYGVWTQPLAAFVGALLTVILVYNLARVGNRVPVHTLLLSGVVVGAVLGSLLMFLVSTSRSEQLHNLVWWMLGDLEIANWTLLWLACGITLAGVVTAFLLSRDLNVLTLGEESASHLGLSVEQTKKLFFVMASLMTGAAVAAAGLIGFVGLIVPHTVRLIIGPDHRYLVPASALAGAIFLVVADTISRTVLRGPVIPIGVITAFVGGPFFLVLLRARKRGYWGG